MRCAKSWIEAMNSQAVADAIVCSKSLRGGGAVEPCLCSLDNPAARENDEALGCIGSLDDLDGPLADPAQCFP